MDDDDQAPPYWTLISVLFNIIRGRRVP